MRIYKANIAVQGSQEILVEWKRGTQKVATEKKMADESNSLFEFERREGLFKISAGFKKGEDGSWLPDESQLILKCGGIDIGTCSFNISSYIGRAGEIEKALIVPIDSTETGIVLKGDAEQFPGAFIEFKITVTSPIEESGDGEKAAMALKLKQMEEKVHDLEA